MTVTIRHFMMWRVYERHPDKSLDNMILLSQQLTVQALISTSFDFIKLPLLYLLHLISFQTQSISSNHQFLVILIFLLVLMMVGLYPIELRSLQPTSDVMQSETWPRARRSSLTIVTRQMVAAPHQPHHHKCAFIAATSLSLSTFPCHCHCWW